MTATVREAQLEDAPILNRLLLELGHDVDEAIVRRRIERIHAATDHVLFVAHERPHGVIGLLHASVALSLTSPPTVELGALVVGSGHREQGTGRALLERLHNWALRRGVDGVAVHFERHRKAGHLFFGKLGYTVTTEHRIYTRDLASPMRQQAEPTKMD